MNGFDDLQRLVHEVTGEAPDEPARFRSFLAVLRGVLSLPADAHVIGEPVELLGLEYSAHSRQGLMARCRRDGREYVVSVADLTLPSASPAARLLAAYRQWCGLEPMPQASAPRPPKAALEDVPEDRPVELVALVLKESAVRCRLLGSDRQITLRSTGLWKLVPGDIVTVQPRKRWTHARHPYMSGEVLGWRFAPQEIGLLPLRLEPRGVWDPGAEGGVGAAPRPPDPRPGCARVNPAPPVILEAEPRSVFEMEEAVPDGDEGAILEAIGACEARDFEHARQVLGDVLARELRCIAARWLLASIAFRVLPREALRYHESGVRIGDLSLPPDFRGVLPWSWPGNQPFLRCLHGYGLCLWRLKRFDEALPPLERLLGLDPADHQGVRAILDAVERRQPWEEVGQGRAGG